jgi:inorganic pyrophosphatase
MQINSIKLHPKFPEKVWIVVEQPRDEPVRLAYDPVSQTFKPTKYLSLFYERGFCGVYGWIGGTGNPPQPHFDIMLVTDRNPRAGDILEGYICGVFVRQDGDYKFVAIDVELRDKVSTVDIFALDKVTYENLIAVYPRVSEGEGWHGTEFAQDYLRKNKATHE